MSAAQSRLSWLQQRTVAPHHPDEVTRVGREVPSSVPTHRIWEDVVGLYQTGLHPAIAMNIVYRGQTILDRTIGHLDNTPGGVVGEVATPDSLFNIFSASKVMTAVLVHALVDDGVLDLEQRVADIIPPFAEHGKQGIRVRHLLNHTAGIPDMPGGFDIAEALAEGRLRLELICGLRPQSRPGENVAYHPVTAWHVLQEIIEQVTGKAIRPLLQERILTPLGFEGLNYGVPLADVGRVALHAVTGPEVPGVMARVFERTIGTGLERAVEMTNGAQFLTRVLPSANVIGTPREVSRFMQMLLRGGELDGTRVLSAAAVRRAVTDVTPLQFDSTFGFPMRYGLGLMMGGRHLSLFGLNTAGAFGHLGLSTVVVYADPARDLCVSFLNTGKPMMAPGMVRWHLALQRIAKLVPRQ